MAAILEMPQYVAYQKNVVYAFIKLSAKSHSFNILCTMDGLSCPTSNQLIYILLHLIIIHVMTSQGVKKETLICADNLNLKLCFPACFFFFFPQH